ncbi:thioesterase family protein [Hydrogenoanaerobacterium sp.]|uniref:acyl-CoA thioesterase n=1 Tax=Hydrogenoanaerobacterium sp. TaxID=2953763 RepID=UPI00289DF619|nr:thioesterase family protein [Hydrogenoanaerobacterium sp.]
MRYAETDQMGVAHHASYPVWYEVARTDFIKTLGITYSEMEAMGVMTPLVELNCRYISATRYEDVLTVETSVSVLSPARIQFDYTIRRQGEPKPVNTGSTMHAWVDSKTFRPINLKKSYPDLYRKILDVMETREE